MLSYILQRSLQMAHISQQQNGYAFTYIFFSFKIGQICMSEPSIPTKKQLQSAHPEGVGAIYAWLSISPCVGIKLWHEKVA